MLKKKKKTLFYQEFLSIFASFIRINQMIWKQKKWQIFLLVVVFTIVGSLPFLSSWINAELINNLIKIINNSISINQYMYLLIGVAISINIFTPILYNLEIYQSKLFWFYIDKHFQLLILGTLGRLDISIHEDPKYKDLINKVDENGIFRLQTFIDRQFYIIQNIIELIIAASILFSVKWWILVVIGLGVIPELYNEIKYGHGIWEIWSTKSHIKRRYFDLRWRFGQIGAITEMKLFQNINKFLGIIEQLYSNFQNDEIKNEKNKLIKNLIAILISQATMALIFLYFINEVLNGHIQIGSFTFYIASVASLRTALSTFTMGLARQYQDNLFVKDIFKLIDTKSNIKLSQNAIKLDKTKPPKIEFKNVSFKYPKTSKFVLKNFSLIINPGEKVAFIGINGAGKTTIIKLLCRFYDPTSGQIFINNINLKKIDLDSWYEILGILFQDYEKYHFTIKEVIALGRSSRNISIKTVKQAAQAAEADYFIEEWEKNYNQMLGKEFKQGKEPSIGQWQKIALARTFYRDPKVLVLDEPTASIDAEAEANIFRKLHHLSKDRTVILISHRFSTVRNADKICVIKNGKLFEYGTHQELLKNKKTYHQLFNLQAEGYK
jgi:ATP-binding cassette subfamily B protein